MKELVLLMHPNGETRKIKPGFCWSGFALPALWAISEGLWRPFAFSLLSLLVSQLGFSLLDTGSIAADLTRLAVAALCLCVYPLTMIVFGFYGQKWLLSNLLKNGYLLKQPSHSTTGLQ